MGIVQAAQEIENCTIGLDCVIAKAAAVDLAQIEELQRVGHEVGGAKDKDLRLYVAVVAEATLLEAGHGAGAGKIVCGIDRACIKRNFVVERRMDGIKGERQVLGL